MIKDWWDPFDIQGSPDFIFTSTLKFSKSKIKGWNSNSFGQFLKFQQMEIDDTDKPEEMLLEAKIE